MNDKASQTNTVTKNTWIKPTLITLAVVGILLVGVSFMFGGRGFFGGRMMMYDGSHMMERTQDGYHGNRGYGRYNNDDYNQEDSNKNKSK